MDEVREMTHEWIGFDEDGNNVFGDSIGVWRGPRLQWVSLPDGSLATLDPRRRALLVEMLTQQLDAMPA